MGVNRSGFASIRVRARSVLGEAGLTLAVIMAVLAIGLLMHQLGGQMPLEQQFPR